MISPAVDGLNSICNVLFVPVMVYPLVRMLRRSAIKGSYRRVVLRTIERTLRQVGYVLMVMGLAQAVLTVSVSPNVKSAIYAGVSVLAYLVVVPWALSLWKRDDEDEDDLFKRMRRGLKRWAASLSLGPRTSSSLS